MKNLNMLICFCVLSIGVTQAQTKAVNVFSEVINYYTKANDFALDITYEMYKLENENQKELTEKYVVNVYKQGNLSRMDAVGAKMYTYPEYLISVFEKNKEIVIRNNSSDFSINGLDQLHSFKENYIISIVSDKKNEIFLELIPQKEKEAQTNYSKILIKVDKKTAKILTQELLLKQPIPFPTANGKQEYKNALLKVTFRELEKSAIPLIPQNSSYFIQKEKSGQLKVANDFKGYKIVDRRIK